MEEIILNDKQRNELLDKKRCFICRVNDCVEVVIEYNLKSLETIAYFNCKRCGISGNMVGILPKPVFGGILHKLLVIKKCTICDGETRLDIEFDKILLQIILNSICKKCGTSHIIKKICKSEEELNKLCLEIAEQNIKEKGFVNVKANLKDLIRG